MVIRCGLLFCTFRYNTCVDNVKSRWLDDCPGRQECDIRQYEATMLERVCGGWGELRWRCEN